MVQLTIGEWHGSILGQVAIINGLLMDNASLWARVKALEQRVPKKKSKKKSTKKRRRR